MISFICELFKSLLKFVKKSWGGNRILRLPPGISYRIFAVVRLLIITRILFRCSSVISPFAKSVSL